VIPTIEQILEDYKAGRCSLGEALCWIDAHHEKSQMRDAFAMSALPAHFSDGENHGMYDDAAEWSYAIADAMMKARAA
jgi:hypothetical protein